MKDTQTLRTQYRVSDFVTWQRERTLELNPNFQRRPVWKKGAKSYLIDTIIRGLPIPIIFLRDIPADLKTFKPKRDVVDGQQRIRTILSFIEPSILADFNPVRDQFTISSTHNKELAGKSFNELPTHYKQKILDYQFSVHSFPADTDDREILQIFARMNSTGVKLNAQELRNAEFYGEFKTLAYELAAEQLNRWRDWEIFTPDQIARMNEVELTSEFMLLILDGVLEKSNKTISQFYKDYDQEFEDAKYISDRFRKVFDTIESLFPIDTIRETFSNRTVFYALFLILYAHMYELRTPTPLSRRAKLNLKKPEVIKPALTATIRNSGGTIARKEELPPRVFKALRGATTHASERRVLMGYLGGN
ncbi:MAG TPA: DUF262 domain-containing protein [Candidatus Acidoferrum sp.]|nr:DUF262 domain-containing protein [Candidatus Acidoferrum sp.]